MSDRRLHASLLPGSAAVALLLLLAQPLHAQTTPASAFRAATAKVTRRIDDFAKRLDRQQANSRSYPVDAESCRGAALIVSGDPGTTGRMTLSVGLSDGEYSRTYYFRDGKLLLVTESQDHFALNALQDDLDRTRLKRIGMRRVYLRQGRRIATHISGKRGWEPMVSAKALQREAASFVTQLRKPKIDTIRIDP